MEASHSKLIVGVMSSIENKSILDFIKLFDRSGVSGEKSNYTASSFIEVFKYTKTNHVKKEQDSVYLIGGITVLAVGNSDASCDFESLVAARNMFSDAVNEYKSFLNKSKINDTFSIEPRLILIGERVSHHGQ